MGVCRWTSELPLRGSFSKRSTARRVNGSLSLSTILYMCQPHSTQLQKATLLLLHLIRLKGTFCCIDGWWVYVGGSRNWLLDGSSMACMLNTSDLGFKFVTPTPYFNGFFSQNLAQNSKCWEKKFPKPNQWGFFFWGTIGCTDSEKLKTNSPLLFPRKCSYRSYTPRLITLITTWDTWGISSELDTPGGNVLMSVVDLGQTAVRLWTSRTQQSFPRKARHVYRNRLCQNLARPNKSWIWSKK